jgi:hypothetical protein
LDARGHARGVAQRRLEVEPEPLPDEPAEEPPTDRPPEPRVPATFPPEELPEGAGGALRERQRRWFVERLRFENAQPPPDAAATESAARPG